MPSHKIHLEIVREVNKKLKLNLDMIKLGSVLPDLINEKTYELSHFNMKLFIH